LFEDAGGDDAADHGKAEQHDLAGDQDDDCRQASKI